MTICDFLLWPGPPWPGGAPVPMLSRWRMQEQHGGAVGLSQVQYVFLELPKYAAGDNPQGTIDRWAYFFREAENLEMVPPALSVPPFREALEVARMAGFSAGELDLYDRAKIAEQDARGALSLAERQGRAEGLAEGLLAVLRARGFAVGIAVTDTVRERILAQKDRSGWSVGWRRPPWPLRLPRSSSKLPPPPGKGGHGRGRLRG